MGSFGWGKDRSVIDWLFAEAYRFDFFQAVRLLEIRCSPEKSSEEDGVDFDAESMIPRPSKSEATPLSTVRASEKVEDFVRFKSAVGVSFPTSDIRELTPHTLKSNGESPFDPPLVAANGTPIPEITDMTVNLMGLAGALGPLDMPTTELIIERTTKRDTALRDFLDIFNHKLISLLYRIRKMHRIGLEFEPPGQDRISKYLFSIIGLGTDGLKGRMHLSDRSFLHYAGLLSQQPRSIVGLELMLSDYFKIKVKGHQFVGQWYELEEEQWTRIGEVSGQNQKLGRGAVVLGTRVWDQQAKVEIRLGPLTYLQFLELIPNGWGYRALSDLTRFYLGDTLDVSFRLVLKGTEIPVPMLGMSDEPMLGWTAWLAPHATASESTGVKSIPPYLAIEPKDDSQVVLNPGPRPYEFKSEKLPLFFNLPPADLNDLINRMTVGTYTRFQPIIKQDDEGSSMFAIRSGRVQLTRREENGKEMKLPILIAGDCFGEMSLLLGKRREVTAIALEKCEILELSKANFDKFAAGNPRWRKTLKAYRFGQFGNTKTQVALVK